MKVTRVILSATVAVISAVAVSSCAYDPHYSGASYSSGGYYSSGYGGGYGGDGYGYGSGYGYGGRGFTTTYFVSTGSPRWGYDPYARCYYDYSRRCYYDPYLYGYYPVGYRPRYVHGAPHPHGWSSGHSYIAPPSRIHDRKIDNYHNRTERYRSLDHNWSSNIQVSTQTQRSDSHRDRHISNDRIHASRNASYLGSTQRDSRSRINERSRGNYVNEFQNSRHSDPRTVQPRHETHSSLQQEQINQNHRHTRSNRQVEPNELRGGRRDDFVRPETMRQPENRGEDRRARSNENREREQPANRITEGAEITDEQLVLRR